MKNNLGAWVPQVTSDGNVYRFGEFTVDCARASLRRADAAVPLRPKSFDLLHYLVTHADCVVSKDELLSAIWPQVIVTEDSLTRCVSEVRAALGDGAQQMIKTVTKRGYLFAVPVITLDAEVPAVQEQAVVVANADAVSVADANTVAVTDASTIASAPPLVAANQVASVRRWLRVPRSLALTGIMVAAVLLTVLLTREQHPVAPRLSMVVLPFSNLSADAAHEYVADVISNDLTISLSRLRGAMVIAADSAFTLKGKPVDVKQLGRELAVRYAVQGSARVFEGRVRISARLIDTQNGATLWSDQFDARRAELTQTQDEIVTRLANSLDAELVLADTRRAQPNVGASLDAEDLAMQCDAAWFRLGVKADLTDYAPCEQALRTDPQNIRALLRLANYHALRVSRVQSSNPGADIARGNELVARALSIAPEHYAAHCAKAVVLEGERRIREAIAAAEHCLSLNPNFANGYRVLAAEYFFLAQPDKTLEYVERGIRLSPVDPQMPTFLLFKGWAYFMKGQDNEALLWLRRAAAAAPETPTILAGLTSVLALTGRDAEARATLARYLALKGTRTRTIEQWNYLPDDNAAFKQFDARFKSGLRRAGMAER